MNADLARLADDITGGTWPAACPRCGLVDAHPIIDRQVQCRDAACAHRWGRRLLRTAASNYLRGRRDGRG